MLLRLLTITNLTLYRIACQDEPLPPMPQLQELCLWRCELDAAFCLSLKICKALKTLKIIWQGVSVDYLKNAYPLDTTINYEAIGNLITKSFPRLGKLVLDTREARLFGKSFTELGSLDLSSMTNLKELTVEAHALLGNHVTGRCTPWKTEAPLPRLQHFLPPSITKLAVLTHRQNDHRVQEPKRNQLLILNSCLRYLFDAPRSLRSVHLDMPYHEIQNRFIGLEKLFEGLGFTHSVTSADPEVQRASPVVGATTPKDQRVKLREAFDMWLPDTDSWHTAVIQRLAGAKTKAGVASWRDFMDNEVAEAQNWNR